MKPFLLISFVLLTSTLLSQTTQSKKFILKAVSQDGKDYLLSDSVTIENGKGEKIKVLVEASVPVRIWDKYKGNDEKEYYWLISNMLALKAKSVLKNTLSFEPIKKQYVTWSRDDGAFYTNFKFMGRNGYGNMVETTEIVYYQPNSN